jgi:hypothetical protein
MARKFGPDGMLGLGYAIDRVKLEEEALKNESIAKTKCYACSADTLVPARYNGDPRDAICADCAYYARAVAVARTFGIDTELTARRTLEQWTRIEEVRVYQKNGRRKKRGPRRREPVDEEALKVAATLYKTSRLRPRK